MHCKVYLHNNDCIQLRTYVYCMYICTCYTVLCNIHPVVIITRPPENTTVCGGSDVNISCGYQWATALPVTWIINGTSFTQQEIMNSLLYQLNNPNTPTTLSLTVFSINGSTTFQCTVLSTLNITSTLGTVTVTSGMYVYTYSYTIS